MRNALRKRQGEGEERCIQPVERWHWEPEIIGYSKTGIFAGTRVLRWVKRVE